MNRVINAAAHGMATSQYHTHWQEVNPIKRQGIMPEERREMNSQWRKHWNESNKRQREIKRRFPNSKVLYV